jgi:tetratricopeptide (TPR) repeat protein
MVLLYLRTKMSRHKTKLPQGLVTSDAVHRGRRILSKANLLGVGVGLAILLVVALYVYSVLRPKTAATSPAVTTGQRSDTLLHPEKAISSAQVELQQAKSSQQKAAAYVDLGTAYMNNKQTDLAIRAYQSALTSDSSNQVAALTALANAYYLAGQKAQAISTFQTLVQVLQRSNDPMLQAQAAQYQQVIQRLQKGGEL